MNKKILGSVLMILGTSIGAGMLALPIVTAHNHMGLSLVLLVAAWLLMTVGAFALLEVNLWLEPGTNLISMSKQTLGNWGKWVMWAVYLLLLYSLISAYLAGSSDILQSLLASAHIMVPRWAATVIALFLFGLIVHRGIASVDIVNRGLMSVKLIAYVLLIVMIAPHITLAHLTDGNFQVHNNTFMVMITSFGYAIILPSLRVYLKSDKNVLKKVVLLGSLLPLVVYVIWIVVVQGLIPRLGTHGLIAMSNSASSNSMLMHSVSAMIHSAWIGSVAKLFISICAMTSFLGVSICLTDFIADGLTVSKQGKGGFIIYAISFIPPLLMVLFMPGIFIKALAYAGIWCIILLILLPLLMLYIGRYVKSLDTVRIMPDSKGLIIAGMAVAVALLGLQVFLVV